MFDPAWNEQLSAMRHSWVALEQSRGDGLPWDARLAVLTREEARLRTAGLWQRGPTDLLTVCGLHRWELTQSAALAWTLDPEARHGLEDLFLHALLSETGDLPDLSAPVLIDLELERQHSRADIVVRGIAWHLIIEVKVQAGEGVYQCQRLYDDWKEEADARFIFLSRTGYGPLSAITDEARRAWIAVSWPEVHKLLLRAAATGDNRAAGRPALEEWMRTLSRLYGRRAA